MLRLGRLTLVAVMVLGMLLAGAPSATAQLPDDGCSETHEIDRWRWTVCTTTDPDTEDPAQSTVEVEVHGWTEDRHEYVDASAEYRKDYWRDGRVLDVLIGAQLRYADGENLRVLEDTTVPVEPGQKGIWAGLTCSANVDEPALNHCLADLFILGS